MAETFSTFPHKRWTEFNKTKLDKEQDHNVLYHVCVYRTDKKKQGGRPGLWLAEAFNNSALKLLDGIQRNFTGSKISMSSTKFDFFGPIRKPTWPPRPLIGWDTFDFSSETTEQNSMKLERKPNQRRLTSLCFSDRSPKNKMVAAASDWLWVVRFLLWNHWTELNETWHEERSRRRLPSLCFSGRSVNQNGRPGSFKNGTLYSGARYVALWTPCFIYHLILYSLLTFYSTSILHEKIPVNLRMESHYTLLLRKFILLTLQQVMTSNAKQ